MKVKEDTFSPTGVLEDFFRSSDSETSSSKEPHTDNDAHKNKKPASRWLGFVQLFRTRSKKPLDTVSSSSILKLSRRFGSLREIIAPKFGLDSDLYHMNSPWKSFSSYELQAATNCFSHGL